MSDTEGLSWMSCILSAFALGAILLAVKVFERLKERKEKIDTEEESYMFELLLRASEHIQRPKKYPTNTEQQDACARILWALCMHLDRGFVRSDVDWVVLHTLSAETFAYLATLHAIHEEEEEIELCEASINLARKEYEKTTIFAKTALRADHPAWLDLAFKYSNFLSDLCRDKPAAYRVSHEAWIAGSTLEVKEARRRRGEEEIDPESGRLMGLL